MLNITVDYDETAEKMKNARAIAQLISLADINGMSGETLWRSAYMVEKLIDEAVASFDSACLELPTREAAKVA